MDNEYGDSEGSEEEEETANNQSSNAEGGSSGPFKGSKSGKAGAGGGGGSSSRRSDAGSMMGDDDLPDLELAEDDDGAGEKKEAFQESCSRFAATNLKSPGLIFQQVSRMLLCVAVQMLRFATCKSYSCAVRSSRVRQRCTNALNGSLVQGRRARTAGHRQRHRCHYFSRDEPDTHGQVYDPGQGLL